MKVRDFLQKSQQQLKAAGIGSARLDVLILLEDELGRDRAWTLAHPEVILQRSVLQKLNKKIVRRINHEPLAYIRGFSEFYGRKFIVNKDVLEPRPESETIIDLLNNLLHHNPSIYKEAPCKIVDVGTGSGCLAITAELEVLEAEVIAIDVDPNCLKVARQNSQHHKANIQFYQGDLLKPLRLATRDWRLGTTIVLANLPYVPDNWQINKAAAMEPRIAIFGGKDGLDVYRRLFEHLSSTGRTRREWPEFIFTESLPPQHQALTKIAKQADYKLIKSQDFIQLFSKLEVRA